MSALARARALAFALIALLLALFAVWHVGRFSPATALLAIGLAVGPWLLAARALRRGRPDAYLGALLLTTPYLGYGLMEVVANPGARVFAAATVFVSFALAVALTACLRLSRLEARGPAARTAP